MSNTRNFETQAYAGTVQEVVSMLQQHGKNPEIAEAILRGVNRLAKEGVDPASDYGGGSASSQLARIGYNSKIRVWHEFLTGTGKFQNVDLGVDFLEKGSVIFKKNVLSACREIGQRGDADQFARMLTRLGGDREVVHALREGVFDWRKGQDSGDFASNASEGYGSARLSAEAKKQILTEFDTGTGRFARAFKQSSERSSEAPRFMRCVEGPKTANPKKKGPQFY